MQFSTIGPSSQPQTQQIVIAPAFSKPNNNPQRIQNYKKVLRNLGITEIILGVLSIIFGIIVITTSSTRCYFLGCEILYRGTGEGIWGGIMIVIAGGLGIPCGKKNSSKCLIKTHMAFSIIGALTSGLVFSMVLCLALYNITEYAVVWFSILSFIFIIAMIILIVSSSFCCVVQKCGCRCCVQAYQPYYGQVFFTQQPLANQDIPGNQAEIGQFSQPCTSAYISGNQFVMQPTVMQSSMIQPGVMQSSIIQPGVMQPTLNVKNPYIQNVDASLTANSPPAYEKLPPS